MNYQTEQSCNIQVLRNEYRLIGMPLHSASYCGHVTGKACQSLRWVKDAASHLHLFHVGPQCLGLE